MINTNDIRNNKYQWLAVRKAAGERGAEAERKGRRSRCLLCDDHAESSREKAFKKKKNGVGLKWLRWGSECNVVTLGGKMMQPYVLF